ncbi:hypothetical protein [Streptobacillus notomytis]|uniref:hypothetical protein n=1 Tax=Streptobacillus notomytis TaxID=1712031 RepID=UPI0009364093|nr:hypothetical protein [Streptobacillus notomytis]
MNILFEIIDNFNIKYSENLNKLKFVDDDAEYMFSHLENDIYRIRKLSTTRNANVIFSIKLIKEQEDKDLKTFIDAL